MRAPERVGVRLEGGLAAGDKDRRCDPGRREGEGDVVGGEPADEDGERGRRETGGKGGVGDVARQLGGELVVEDGASDGGTDGAADGAASNDEARDLGEEARVDGKLDDAVRGVIAATGVEATTTYEKRQAIGEAKPKPQMAA